jgi:hypothetical protein
MPTGSAFGLSIDAVVPLGPLAAAAPACVGHELALEWSSPERLAAAWSGPASPRPWRGRLGDGEELTIGWGLAGDLLFRYGELADFRLDRGRSRLECAPLDPEAPAWRRVLLTRVLPNVAIAAGFEALHASAIATEHGVLAFLGPSGAGKSTLALEFVRRGRALFADDTVALSRLGGAVEAHPAGPFMNLPPAAQPPLGAEDLGYLGGERWVAVAGAAASPAHVAAIVLLERRAREPLRARPARQTPLVLAPFMLGLPDEEGRDSARFSLYSDLIEDTRLLHLGAGLRDRPGDLADALEAALELSPGALLGATA